MFRPRLIGCAALAMAVASASWAVFARQATTPPGVTPGKSAPAHASKPPSSADMGDMPDMADMNHDRMQQSTEASAHQQMARGHHMHMGAHMYMTSLRPQTSEDWVRADQIATELREAIEPYKDYRAALGAGYRIFMPHVPQDIYHFTNYENAFLEAFTFDPGRPTSLLYRKTSSGYELVGAMFTMPRSATEEQLNARIPLSVAQWHQHTNLCLPPAGTPAGAVDFREFGLEGSIATPQACEAAGGRFLPVIFGWMVHVYPFESTREKIWEQ